MGSRRRSWPAFPGHGDDRSGPPPSPGPRRPPVAGGIAEPEIEHQRIETARLELWHQPARQPREPSSRQRQIAAALDFGRHEAASRTGRCGPRTRGWPGPPGGHRRHPGIRERRPPANRRCRSARQCAKESAPRISKTSSRRLPCTDDGDLVIRSSPAACMPVVSTSTTAKAHSSSSGEPEASGTRPQRPSSSWRTRGSAPSGANGQPLATRTGALGRPRMSRARIGGAERAGRAHPLQRPVAGCGGRGESAHRLESAKDSASQLQGQIDVLHDDLFGQRKYTGAKLRSRVRGRPGARPLPAPSSAGVTSTAMSTGSAVRSASSWLTSRTRNP